MKDVPSLDGIPAADEALFSQARTIVSEIAEDKITLRHITTAYQRKKKNSIFKDVIFYAGRPFASTN